MKRILKKYYSIFQISWQESFQYREEMIFWALFNGLRIGAIILLWKSIFAQESVVGGITFETITAYYIATYFISRTISTDFEDEYISQIKSGEISVHFLKPFSFKRLVIVKSTSWRILNLLVSVAFPAMIIKFFAPQFIPIPSLGRMILVGVFLILAYTLLSLMSFIIIGIAFFMDQGKTLQHFKWMLTGILGGSMLPLELYPHGLQTIARALPFQFNYAVPISIYLNTEHYQDYLQLMGLALFWIAILWAVMNFIWKRSMRRFTAVGA